MQLVRVYLDWLQRNLLLKCVLQPEIAKKFIITPILAFKVIQGHWIRRQSRASVWLPISDYALSHTVTEIQRLIGLKPQFSLPPSHLVLSFGVSLFEFMEKLYGS